MPNLPKKVGRHCMQNNQILMEMSCEHEKRKGFNCDAGRT